MTDISDLMAQYKRFDEIEPISSVREIKPNTIVKIRGTLKSYDPDDTYRKTTGDYTSNTFRGRIGIKVAFGEDQEEVDCAGNYVGLSGQTPYNVLNTLLDNIGIGGELEIVMRKAAGSKQDSVLQRIIGNGEHLVRGSGRVDYLQKISLSTLIAWGVIKAPDDDESG